MALRMCLAGGSFSLDAIDCHPLDVYDNVFFWKKYQRMNFIDRILELSRSGNIVIYGDETKDAFEEDWESKLRSHPDIPLFLELNRRFTKPSSFDDTRGAPDASMKKCIETIRDLYFNFECLKQQLELSEAMVIQFVEFEPEEQKMVEPDDECSILDRVFIA
ncbi:hypothetical protein HS088_TW19G00895 [Tripterygium wilfordii]|uniref:Uncharacterized protein n=1 Tax=Tripterygium wilfordii TaxID=458696 RepID=A0A7J7CAW2_TRIWF|nr:hypothetical protein HS088_TW19G00895 [Tripterygium wilfordii]